MVSGWDKNSGPDNHYASQAWSIPDWAKMLGLLVAFIVVAFVLFF